MMLSYACRLVVGHPITYISSIGEYLAQEFLVHCKIYQNRTLEIWGHSLSGSSQSRPCSWPSVTSTWYSSRSELSAFLQVLQVLIFTHLFLSSADGAPLCYGSKNSPSSFQIQFKYDILCISRQNDMHRPLCSSLMISILLLPFFAWRPFVRHCTSYWPYPDFNTQRWTYNKDIIFQYIDGGSLVQKGHMIFLSSHHWLEVRTTIWSRPRVQSTCSFHCALWVCISEALV